ncbi:MAG: sensor histidine kinase, partial [Verrucomicrobia bacterium]
GALVWIRQLHRKVAERTQALRATMARLEEETKTSATLAERNRLAAEIHDGLEQGLNGIMMQLDGVETKLSRSPEGAKHHLDLARKMVRFSRTEVRHSLWDWKAPALADHDLKTALSDIVSQMANGNLTHVDVQVSGNSRPLPPAMEHHLLRITQEALTNALKHAQARTVTVSLNFADDAVLLSVRDDGRGFVPATVLNGMVGHLGLQNLRSRARKLGGELTVTSEPGNGATIAVRIPCAPGGTKPD